MQIDYSCSIGSAELSFVRKKFRCRVLKRPAVSVLSEINSKVVRDFPTDPQSNLLSARPLFLETRLTDSLQTYSDVHPCLLY